jgi:predicted transcriptional regulator
MERQNVTLALPKDLLRRAKIMAVEENSSLSRLLTTALADMVDRRERYRDARHTHLTILAEGYDMGLNGKISWSRDDLHER